MTILIFSLLILLFLIIVGLKYEYYAFDSSYASFRKEENWLSTYIKDDKLASLFILLIEFNYYNIDLPAFSRFVETYDEKSSYKHKGLYNHIHEILTSKPSVSVVFTLKKIKKILLLSLLLNTICIILSVGFYNTDSATSNLVWACGICILNYFVIFSQLKAFTYKAYHHFYKKIDFDKSLNRFLAINSYIDNPSSKLLYSKLNDIYSIKSLEMVNEEVVKYLEILILMRINKKFNNIHEVTRKFLNYIDNIPTFDDEKRQNETDYVDNLIDIKRNSY